MIELRSVNRERKSEETENCALTSQYGPRRLSPVLASNDTPERPMACELRARECQRLLETDFDPP
jgi:hypothetical protein